MTEKGNFELVIEPGDRCAPEIEKLTKLGAENRDYLVPHIKTSDPDLAAKLDAFKKRKRSRNKPSPAAST